MKIKCFFCEKYSINIKKHIKVCKDFRQLSDDVFNNCILSLVRLEKLKECINKKMYYLFNGNYFNKDNTISFYNDLNKFYFNQKWFIENISHKDCWKCEYKDIELFIIDSFKNNNLDNILITLGNKNIKSISIFNNDFSKIGIFFHKYTKKNIKSYYFSIIEISMLENLLNSKGINNLFEVATIYNSFKLIKKNLNNIYENI